MDTVASDYLDVTFIAKNNIKARSFASDEAPVYDNFVSGDIVGRVFSWVMRGATIWWMFDGGLGRFYYVKHEENIFKWSDADNAIIKKNIVNRGGSTTEIDKEQRNKNLTSLGWKIAGGLGLAYISKRVIDKAIK